jgi:hypothetical protein
MLRDVSQHCRLLSRGLLRVSLPSLLRPAAAARSASERAITPR